MSASDDIIDHLHAEIVRGARQRGVHWRVATELAFQVEQVLRERFGGSNAYIRIPCSASPAMRAQEIRDQYDGTNRDALCRRYAISRRTFYRYLAQARE